MYSNKQTTAEYEYMINLKKYMISKKKYLYIYIHKYIDKYV